MPSARDPLTTRLARLGAQMREDENKALISEAVLALFEGEAAIAASATNDAVAPGECLTPLPTATATEASASDENQGGSHA